MNKPHNGFVLITILLLLGLATAACLMTLQMAQTSLLIAANRAYELRMQWHLDSAMANYPTTITLQTSSTDISISCDTWRIGTTPIASLSVTRWHWRTPTGHARNRETYREFAAAPAC